MPPTSTTTAQTLTFALPTTLVIGLGALGAAPEHVRALGIRKALVVCDPGVEAAAGADLRAALRGASIEHAVTLDVEPQPTVANVRAAAEAYAAHGCDGVAAIGGGSAIDTAKGAAVLATNGGDPRDYHGDERFATAPAPLLAIPTTAGTGSEVSSTASIRDAGSGRKLSIRHRRFNPARVAILDPAVLATLPPHVAVVAGLDALAHGIESYASRQATVLTQALSLRAVELVAQSIRAFVADRADADAGERMLVGACLAGIGFSFAGTGNAHCLARTLAGEFHMEHGMSVAVTLPHVVAYNAPARPDAYARVAAALGADTAGLDAEEAALLAAPAIAALNHDLGLPRSLRAFGVGPGDVEHIARESAAAGYERWNPRDTTERDFAALLERML